MRPLIEFGERLNISEIQLVVCIIVDQGACLQGRRQKIFQATKKRPKISKKPEQ